jgi:hypothetical protein
MKTKIIISSVVIVIMLALSAKAQEPPAQRGFVISLKNGSTIRGRTLARDESSGKLRLTMTEAGAGTPKSYAIISMDDAEAIRASSAETDSILIRLLGGSELRCKEFNLNGDSVSVKLGSASRVEVRWDQIESISFAP